MGDRFVSEDELAEARKKRQEEWEKVRTAEDPADAPEPEVDNRPLYDRLKEQKDKKDEEYQEAHRMKNMVRGLDTEETDFLNFVDKMKAKELSEKAEEEERLVREIKERAAAEGLKEPPVAAVLAVPKKTKPSGGNKQASILSAAIKRKSTASSDGSPPEKNERKNGESGDNSKSQIKSGLETIGIRPSGMKCLGVLPGLADYNPSSGEDSDSDSSESEPESALLPRIIQQTQHKDSEKGGGCASQSNEATNKCKQ